MEYSNLFNYASILMTVLFFLVFTVNIIVEVLKVFVKKLPTNYLAVAVSIIVTILAMAIWITATNTPFRWYYIVAALVIGIFVSYGAMFGFDKFKDGWDKLKNMRKTTEEDN